MGGSTFQSTCWSIVRDGSDVDPELRRAALERLCTQYWFPLYAFLRRGGRDPERAADLVQGFFERLLSRDGLATVTPEGGRFRTWLLAALRNHERDEVGKERAAKRGGGAAPVPIDAEEGERRMELAGAALEDPALAYDRAWALAVLDQGRLLLEHELRASGDGQRWETLGPLLDAGAEARPREELARELGVTPVALRVAILRLRRRYQELLARVVADALGSTVEAGAELELLSAALTGESRDSW